MNMIFDNPSDWKDLQDKVCRIMNEVGFEASTSKTIQTPRGQVEIDVYATDPESIDKIVYIIECKNWKSKIPQTVVHAFTTTMYETGANVGYVISKTGFQKGANDYIKNTPIINYTYEEFQEKYLIKWIEKAFIPRLKENSHCLISYTEPINTRRERYINNFSKEQKKRYEELQSQYYSFSVDLLALTYFEQFKQLYSTEHNNYRIELIKKINDLKSSVKTCTNENCKSTSLEGLLNELIIIIRNTK